MNAPISPEALARSLVPAMADRIAALEAEIELLTYSDDLDPQ